MELQDVARLKTVASSNSNLKKSASVKPVSSGIQRPRFAFQGLKVPKPAELIPATSDDRQKALDDFRTFKADLASAMAAHVGNIRAIEGMVPDEAVLYQDTLAEAKKAVDDMLAYPDPARKPAIVAYACATVDTCPSNRREVENMLLRLKNIYFLASNPKGIKIYGDSYTVAGDFSKEDGANQVLGKIENLVQRTVDAGREAFQEAVETLRNAVGPTPLSEEDLQGGKEGRCLLDVPDSPGKDGRFFKGGYLLVESIRGEVRVLDAAGGIHRLASKMAAEKISLPVDQLGHDRIELSRRVDDERFRAMLTLNNWIRLAFAEAEKEIANEKRKAEFREETDQELAGLTAKASISLEEFLSGKVGIAVVDFGHKPFELRLRSEGGSTDKNGKPKLVWRVFCLAERNEAGQIRVVECPPRLATFFSDFMGFQEPGENYNRLGRFGHILRYLTPKTK